MTLDLEKKRKINKDLATAKELCRELKLGNKGAIVGIYEAYSRGFLLRIQQLLYDSKTYKPEDVFSEFWEKKLLSGDVFCNYTAKNESSLRNYLYKILYFFVVEINRKILRERKVFRADSEIKETPDNSPKTPEQDIVNPALFNQKLISEAFLQLSELSPKDAAYIKMYYLEGMQHRGIAVKESGEVADKKTIDKKTCAIRKQITRPRTGSLARFRVIMERLMKKHNLSIKDLLE